MLSLDKYKKHKEDVWRLIFLDKKKNIGIIEINWMQIWLSLNDIKRWFRWIGLDFNKMADGKQQ